MFPILAGNSASTGYNLTRSLRFRRSAGGYLNRTAGAGNQQIMTLSFWFKRGVLGVAQYIFGSYSSGSAFSNLYIESTDQIGFADAASATNLLSTQVFRDPSAWYHIVVAIDTTQATAANRVKFYVNNVQITAFASSTYPAQNANLNLNSAVNHTLFNNAAPAATNYTDGYLAETNFVNASQLTPSSFGSTNALTGVWQPAQYTGTYGTNGFYLPFTDNSALTTASNVGLGKDFSGNGNYWTTNNISITAGVTYDSMTDVPTLTSATAANFAVINPLFNGSVTVSAGNLNASVPGAGYQSSVSTITFPTSGKFYFEVTIVSNNGSGNNQQMGITALPLGVYNFGLDCFATSGTSARKVNNNTVGADLYGPVSNGTVFGVAVDATNGKAYIAVNNTYIDSSSPTGGTGGYSMISGQQYFALFNGYSSGVNAYNFGQRPFAYTPPTGFVSLNTFNLPDSTIVKGNTVMDATLYTGTGASLSVTNTASFKPDLVWVKSRSAATDHAWYDSVRGTTKQLESNTTTAETTEATGLTAFGSAGFTVGALAQMNTSSATYVGWQWQAGQGSSSSNTNGTITSTVSVNASAGFSVVTATSPASGNPFTLGHGLGVAPAFIISKSRSGTGNWSQYHASTGAGGFLTFTTSAFTANTDTWNNTAPTSSVISTTTNWWGFSSTLVFYCWTPIAGFSAFGSYTGNGSATGPFVYTGFQPKFILIKSTTAGRDWILWDTVRNTFNIGTAGVLFPDTSGVEYSGGGAYAVAVTSNGFYLPVSTTNLNASGETHIYAAFATVPFKNSLAQ
jgi:hypothetical protein